MLTLEAGSKNIAPTLASHRQHGFTLIELLVVIAIIAMGTAGVAFAIRDSADTQLEREGQRLAAMLESARAQSRSTGVPVNWKSTDTGFKFTGLSGGDRSESWQSEGVTVDAKAVLNLGPEPLIGRQEVFLSLKEQPGKTVRVMSDGLRPFAVVPSEPIVSPQ
ncbi:MAG TPA: prepilin-type N-terminal cleavage/methylation domain-containing protein [Burkholderiaceae bacterium]|nr:prepilin-type N-terminal cleavage/methylation domain-containing protein [Rhodoferax sp.]MBP9064391.1 prepilin-type N-terminal cleavage/methylation domain-containing protein [Aquabacterium sp.]HNW01523.1 prepilin-type N-terminal cleavage/methylation domain-containing protein [Burkholderiaceae bacterium]